MASVKQQATGSGVSESHVEDSSNMDICQAAERNNQGVQLHLLAYQQASGAGVVPTYSEGAMLAYRESMQIAVTAVERCSRGNLGSAAPSQSAIPSQALQESPHKVASLRMPLMAMVPSLALSVNQDDDASFESRVAISLTILNNMALLCFEQSEFLKAQTLLDLALNLASHSSSRLSAKHNEVSTPTAIVYMAVYYNRCRILHEQSGISNDKLHKSMEYLMQALSCGKRLPPPGSSVSANSHSLIREGCHLLTAEVLQLMGEILVAANYATDAVAFFQEALLLQRSDADSNSSDRSTDSAQSRARAA